MFDWARYPAQRVIDRTGTALLAPPRTGFGAVVNHGDRAGNRVALTYDDGPSDPATSHTVAALADLDVRATFFVIGDLVRKGCDTLQRIAAEGHVVGCHTEFHSRRDATSIRDTGHIERAADEIERVVGARPALYRPPWGWLTPWEARRARQSGMRVIGWDVYPPDWRLPTPSPAEIASFVCREAQPGSIILLHDGQSASGCAKTETALATRSIVSRLRNRGLEFVTVPELLGLPAYV